ncbi:MAG TPA: NAD-binding protein [Myxococcota bacterium]|nr:NAD-binding protein [Myxococcota bacterium]
MSHSNPPQRATRGDRTDDAARAHPTSHANPSHCVAVIGGAVAGAEVAGALAQAGCEVVVFEQNARPYGKIEDGLPRWHEALREKEYAAIGERLRRPGVRFVPCTRVGEHVGFRELVRDWGFSAVVLANGAWRDRPLPIEGIDAYVGKGLIYQNPFVIGFNHMHDPTYSGPRFEALDGALVIGGGLASIDVVKILMLETTRAALAKRGIEVDVIELEVKGIPKLLATHGLAFSDLGLEGCTLFYRRSEQEMPLVEIPEDATPERVEKVRGSRAKLLEKAREKYCFKVEALAAPEQMIVENGRLVGLMFRRMRVEAGKLVPTDERFERRGSCVVSSIGSIPLPIEGIEMKGELFRFADWELGRLDAYPTVFSAGNIVTGKGNIIASRKHARQVTQLMVEDFLGIAHAERSAEAGIAEVAGARVRASAERIAAALEKQPPIRAEALESIRARVAARQREVGYDGDFDAWIARVSPGRTATS